MDYTTLGHTGLLVSKLCFGTMTFGEPKDRQCSANGFEVGGPNVCA
jgi:aryl-alcohol dehydrogenase-like predicted oxidoreductase